jgi:formylglycine-generating enzyme required for sulfatase activity
VCVNWKDARAYVAWLSEATGYTYRLLSEAEWEYAARAGTTEPFWWGSSITPAQANYKGDYVYEGGGGEGEYRQSTVPVGSFEPNPWGLYNVHGNIWEWCEDTWHENYTGAPADGSAWVESGDGDRRVVRGGSWGSNPRGLRSAFRFRSSTGVRSSNLGFRVGRTLTP